MTVTPGSIVKLTFSGTTTVFVIIYGLFAVVQVVSVFNSPPTCVPKSPEAVKPLLI